MRQTWICVHSFSPLPDVCSGHTMSSWHLQGIDIAWSNSHSEANSQMNDSERTEKLANVWWSSKDAKLGKMVQFGWRKQPFSSSLRSRGDRGVTKDAAASSSMFITGVRHLWPPSPSSFLILSRTSMMLNPFWVLRLFERFPNILRSPKEYIYSHT